MAVAAPPFAGFTPEAIQFLADLGQNNDRAWFQPRKAEFERLLKEPFEAMIVALAERLEARGVPMRADPKRSPFRIYRDTRFSKDKSPYKDHLGASFPWLGGSGRPEKVAARTTSGRTATAAISTSSRARCMSAAACGRWRSPPRRVPSGSP